MSNNYSSGSGCGFLPILLLLTCPLGFLAILLPLLIYILPALAIAILIAVIVHFSKLESLTPCKRRIYDNVKYLKNLKSENSSEQQYKICYNALTHFILEQKEYLMYRDRITIIDEYKRDDNWRKREEDIVIAAMKRVDEDEKILRKQLSQKLCDSFVNIINRKNIFNSK